MYSLLAVDEKPRCTQTSSEKVKHEKFFCPFVRCVFLLSNAWMRRREAAPFSHIFLIITIIRRHRLDCAHFSYHLIYDGPSVHRRWIKPKNGRFCRMDIVAIRFYCRHLLRPVCSGRMHAQTDQQLKMDYIG